MEFDKSSLELIDVINDITQDEHVAVFGDENLMTVSWNGHAKEGALFHLVLRAKKPAYLSDAIRLNDRITRKEAYKNGKLYDVVTGFDKNQEGQTYTLYQNTPNPLRMKPLLASNYQLVNVVQLKSRMRSEELLKYLKLTSEKVIISKKLRSLI